MCYNLSNFSLTWSFTHKIWYLRHKDKIYQVCKPNEPDISFSASDSLELSIHQLPRPNYINAQTLWLAHVFCIQYTVVFYWSIGTSTQDVPVVKEFIYEAKKIQRDGRNMAVVHGEIVPHHDVLGERSGMYGDQVWSTLPALELLPHDRSRHRNSQGEQLQCRQSGSGLIMYACISLYVCRLCICASVLGISAKLDGARSASYNEIVIHSRVLPTSAL